MRSDAKKENGEGVPFGRKLRLKMERKLMMERKEEEGWSLLKVDAGGWCW